jgi:hypothetical protein
MSFRITAEEKQFILKHRQSILGVKRKTKKGPKRGRKATPQKIPKAVEEWVTLRRELNLVDKQNKELEAKYNKVAETTFNKNPLVKRVEKAHKDTPYGDSKSGVWITRLYDWFQEKIDGFIKEPEILDKLGLAVRMAKLSDAELKKLLKFYKKVRNDSWKNLKKDGGYVGHDDKEYRALNKKTNDMLYKLSNKNANLAFKLLRG